MTLQLIITKDGSHSLHLPELNENYHSVAGAITESKHIFIKHGLLHSSANPLKVFEIGFGTGLNALLTRLVASETKKTVYYTSIEKYPVDISLVDKFNYPEWLHISKDIFRQLHLLPWDIRGKADDYFYLNKIAADWLEFKPPDTYDIVYYDAFAPVFQPDMWTEAVLKKTYNCMNPGGILTTYTVKGEVKRGLVNAGFSIEKLKGPTGGKRENLRAIKPKRLNG